MGINTCGFIHSGNAKRFDFLSLVDYLRENYRLTGIYPGDDLTQIGFLDGADKRLLSVFPKYESYIYEGYPNFENTARSGLPYNSKPYIVLFDVNCWGNSDDIIKGVVLHFGGGYLIHNDCDSDWETI